MLHPNEFDGNAAFSGGGFMPSQGTQTPDPSNFSSSRNIDARCLLPLTVKQLKDLSKTSEFCISVDGIDVNNIVIVGIVSKIDNAVTDCTFRVDDGTGWVECTKWVHEHIDSVEVDAISVGMYVRVYGQLKSIQSRRTLHTFSIRPLTDFNEITSHFIECIYVHLYNTRLRGGISTQPQLSNPTIINPTRGHQANLSNQFSGQNRTEEEQIMDISSRVLAYLRQPACLASENGAHCDVIARELITPVDKIRKALDYLASDGLVYSTTDDHFKFTDV